MIAAPSGFWEVLNACGAAVAAGCALYVTFRDGRRLKSGEAKALSDQIAKAQLTGERWHESEPGKQMRKTLDRHDRELIKHSGILATVATKQDVERVEGDVKRVLSEVEAAGKGVDRIEGLLMKRALDPERH